MTATEARGDYRIEEVAARTGFTKRTLHYYEEIGLITPAGRSEGNYRLYSEADVARLQRIKRLKDVLGIPLSSLKRLAEVEETLDALGTELRGPLDPQQRRMRLLQAYAELEQQLRTIDERLATLTHMRAELADASRGSSKCCTPETRRHGEVTEKTAPGLARGGAGC